MDEIRLDWCWDDIPTEKAAALTYSDLTRIWNVNERQARKILHDLSTFDNGDDYVLIRSARTKGFYKTDDPTVIKAYKQECLNKGRSIFAPIKKINRVLNANISQYGFENNMRVIRERSHMKQSDVVNKIKEFDRAIDTSLLSKMENGVCLPTPVQLQIIAEIYNCQPDELINGNLYL